MALSDSERLVYLQRLADAETSYHNLLTGKSARVVVDQNSERVEFTAANATKLYSYIISLKEALGLLATTATGRYDNGPAGFVF
jgi:hypothetical protein